MIKIQAYSLAEFPDIDSAYWGLGAKNEDIYFGLCTHDPNKSASLFHFNPKNKQISRILSLSDFLPSKPGYLLHGKIHTPIFTGSDGKLYFGTHFAYPYGKPQNVKYEGGHIICYDPKIDIAYDLGIPVKNEGVITMILDKSRMILYGLTAPNFNFFSYKIKEQKLKRFGRITTTGSICRALAIDDLGNVYGSLEKNRIFRLDFQTDKIQYLNTQLINNANKVPEWKGEYRKGVNFIGRKIWRSALWNQTSRLIYGIHAEDSQLFEFNTENGDIKNVCFFGKGQFRKNLNNIYPTLSMASYKDKIFYTPASGFFDYSRSKNISSSVSLVSYDISKKSKRYHGLLMSGNRKILGIGGSAVTNSGILYLLGAIEVLNDKNYNAFNKIGNKGFNLALIQVDLKKLNYE